MPKERKTTIQHGAPMTKRQRARWEQEQLKQRRVIFGVAGVLAVVVVLLIAGILWDKVFVPNRTVAKVGTTEISNAEYQRYRKVAQAQAAYANYSTALQFAQYQQSGGQDFLTQVEENIKALNDKNSPLDYSILNQMIDNRLVELGTADMGITATDEQINQKLAEQFAAQQQTSTMNVPTPVTSTDSLTPTSDLSGTGDLSGTSDLSATAALSPTATPTFTAAEAQNSVEIGLTNYFGTLREFIETPPQQIQIATSKLPFTYDDFKAYVIQQERADLLRSELGKKLKPEAEAPKQVVADADQIFIQVTVPPTATEELSATLWAEGRERIQAIQQKLDKGASFDDLMQSDSELDTASQPTNTGLQPLSYWDSLSITQPISTQEVGVIGEPYRSPLGWHIVRVNERTEQTDQQAWEDSRGQAIADWLKEQREKLGVELFPAPTPTPAPPTIDPALLPPSEAPAEAPPAEVTPTP